MLTRLIAAFAVAALAAPAAAQSDVEQHHESAVATSVVSPGDLLKVDLTVNGEGRVGYQVSRQGRAIIGESHLGFLFTDQPQMPRKKVTEFRADLRRQESAPGPAAVSDLNSANFRSQHRVNSGEDPMALAQH